jgi:hypothetical protein
MDEQRRQALRSQYLKLTREYRREIAEYDCGSQLAEYLHPKLFKLGREIREIEAEVWQAIQDEEKASARVDIVEEKVCPHCGKNGQPEGGHDDRVGFEPCDDCAASSSEFTPIGTTSRRMKT